MSKSGRAGRRLSEDERALWHAVTRSVAPLPRRKPANDKPEPEWESRQPTAARKPAGAIAVAAPAKPKALPPLAPLDRRARQRLDRGTEKIEARLDLHGHTQTEAYATLSRFLHAAQGRGTAFALVITGKGGRGGGVLRRQVPLWLATPEFRALVVSVETAGRAHGGEGALYVRLRKRRP
jgi:DNA-nicking Smr family endonuclease